MVSKSGWVLIGGLGALALLSGRTVVEEIMGDKKEGLAKLAAAAKPVADEYHIPISLIVTQAAHESNFGRSGLATKSNNLFGIKAGTSWTGKVDVWPTWEVISGKEIKVTAGFRKYATWEDSVRDWLKVIKQRYPAAFMMALADNAKGFFDALQKGGYATDPDYSTKLAGVYQSLEALI